MRLRAVVLSVLLVGSVIGSTGVAGAAVSGPQGVDTVQEDAPPDPDEDVIGWHDGYWHNESIDVDQSDGLSDSELDQYVARAIARVEFLRQAEFDEDVPVSIVSREEFQSNQQTGGELTRRNRWNGQVWEGLFIVGEDRTARDALSAVFGGSVGGFFSPTRDEIVIVSDNPDTPVIDNATLVHELVHALQDQRFNLASARYSGDTQDENIAIDGLVEGEANYIETNYVNRCGDEWDCVSTPSSSSGGGGGDINLGIFLTIFTPYSDGPVYVSDLYEEGGWDAVDRAFENPPQSSEQIIQRTSDEPERLTFKDTAENGWSLFPNQGVEGAETVGEASIYSMFWYQARNYGAKTIQWQAIGNAESQYDTYNYNAGPSAGWANDKLVPYQKGEGDSAEYGYVWKMKWDTVQDATEFREAYLEILAAHDATQRDDGVYVIPEGPFADAFIISQTDDVVTIVNGPDAEAVTDIRPDATAEVTTPEPTATPTPTATPEPTPADGTDGGTTTVTETGGDDVTTTPVPGFGGVVAAIALAIAGLLALRRR